jgi:hypothetical protein
MWHEDWERAKEHHLAWWRGEGFVISGGWATKPGRPWEQTRDPGPATSLTQRYTDASWRAEHAHHQIAQRCLTGDLVPLVSTDIGPGSLATFLGSEPELAEDTVWYQPCIEDPESSPPLAFDPENRWWRIHEAVIRACVERSRGRYFVGCPDLIENLDTLASLRGTQTVLMDLIERPDWVQARLGEINQAFFAAYQRIYDLIAHPDGSAAWGAFGLWAPGKMAKVQCDISAMLSPRMFGQFVAPWLEEQCQWLDYSMFHLDGADCIPHLDRLLAIESLDAIEWTPNPGVPRGDDPYWFPMYRRILEAGKSVQMVSVSQHQVVPILDALGPRGLYLMLDDITSADQLYALERAVEPYR